MKESFFESADIRMRELLQDGDFPSKCRNITVVVSYAIFIGRIFLDLVRRDHLDGVPLTTLTVHSFVHGRK